MISLNLEVELLDNPTVPLQSVYPQFLKFHSSENSSAMSKKHCHGSLGMETDLMFIIR